MIDEKDVIRMKIPYPTIQGGLAAKSHMYICKKSQVPNHEFIKCQTLKPYMLYQNIMQHYYDEEADINRNPFRRKTRIDCDKLFTTRTVQYDPRMKTSPRSDVCEELYRDVLRELTADGYETVALDEEQLKYLNYLIQDI